MRIIWFYLGLGLIVAYTAYCIWRLESPYRIKKFVIILKNDWKKFKWRFLYSKRKKEKLLKLLEGS